MIVKPLRFAITLAGVMSMSLSLFAAPIPVRDIPALTSRSDLVVLGMVTAVSDGGAATIDAPGGSVFARLMVAEIRIDHPLKGESGTDTIDCHFVVPEAEIGYGSVEASSYGVFFLRRVEEHYTFTSPYYPSLRAYPTARIDADSPLDRVSEVIASTIGVQTASAQQKREAIQILWDIPGPIARQALRAAIRETDPSVRLPAAAGLLAINDLSALPVAEATLLRSDPAVPATDLHNLRVSLRQGVRDPSAAPALVRLLGAESAETRRAAAFALGRTDAHSAMEPLTRALDDGDFEVRLTAIRALATLTGETQWAPSEEAFRSDENRYVDHFKRRIPR